MVQGNICLKKIPQSNNSKSFEVSHFFHYIVELKIVSIKNNNTKSLGHSLVDGADLRHFLQPPENIPIL